MGQDNSTQRLCNDELHSLHPDIKVPSYDRSQIKTGIVHIGPSAFFRGHVAVYVDDLLQQGETEWGICAVSLRSSHVRDALAPQDNLFTVVEQSNQGNTARVIGSVNKVLVAKESPQAVLDQMASPDVKMVTLTVTQAGYSYKNGSLDFDDENIKADLLKADEPTSTVGYIVKALEMRMERGLPPFTVMSCDNLNGNGTILRNVVLTYARKYKPELHDWINDHVEFPSTMVDRIVPRTTSEHIQAHKQTYGILDAWPIYTEKFRQFVIEKPKNLLLPDFSKVGALMVDDVAPFELMKIRMLNGVHMALGMIGRMAGYNYAHEAIKDARIRDYITDLMADASETLHPVPGVDIEQYQATIFERLDNAFMNDHLWRLARSGVDKIDSRFLGTIRDAFSRDTPKDNLIFAVACWAEYLKRSGPDFNIHDDRALDKNLPEEAQRGGTSCSLIVENPAVFGTDLAASRIMSEGFERHMKAFSHVSDILNALPLQQPIDMSAAIQKASGPAFHIT